MRFRVLAFTLLFVPTLFAGTFRGGSFAPIERPNLPAYAEEWEAFLSIDGGAHYDFRVTPHLDARLQRFTWLVPNADTNDARLLLRFGDERHETIVELPGRFSIRRDARAELAFAHCGPQLPREAARPGDAPVVSQAEGDRHGSNVSVNSDVARHRGVRSAVRERRHASDAIAAPPATAVFSVVVLSIERAQRIRVTTTRALRRAEVLELTTRLNI